jgi:hypothetical protein
VEAETETGGSQGSSKTKLKVVLLERPSIASTAVPLIVILYSPGGYSPLVYFSMFAVKDPLPSVKSPLKTPSNVKSEQSSKEIESSTLSTFSHS